jgi:hypothetical protein
MTKEGVRNGRWIEKRKGMGRETAARTSAPYHHSHCWSALNALFLVCALVMIRQTLVAVP